MEPMAVCVGSLEPDLRRLRAAGGVVPRRDEPEDGSQRVCGQLGAIVGAARLVVCDEGDEGVPLIVVEADSGLCELSVRAVELLHGASRPRVGFLVRAV